MYEQLYAFNRSSMPAFQSLKGHAKTWFRDPAVYPLVALLGTAVVGASTFAVLYALRSPDVRYVM